MVYTPDKWLIIEVGGQSPHHRVFGSWSGGYLYGDSWRMNSGINGIHREDKTIVFTGYSGSEYAVHEEMYGASAYNWSVAKSYEDTNTRVLNEDEAFAWIENWVNK